MLSETFAEPMRKNAQCLPFTNGMMQVASCERTILPSGQAAAEVKRILGQQQQFEAAMRCVNLGSRTGVKQKRKSTGELIVHVFACSM